MEVFIQRSADRRFFKAAKVWVSSKKDALAFSSCTDAIVYCIERGIIDARLCLSFGDSKYDLFLDVFRAETRALLKENRELREQQRALLAKLDSVRADSKETKKRIPFRRKRMGNTEDGRTPSA